MEGGREAKKMTTRTPNRRRANHSQSERSELAEWLANFKPKTKLGLKLTALSKQGLENDEPLLDADGILKELGRRRYDD
jgi:hypothetical protein